MGRTEPLHEEIVAYYAGLPLDNGFDTRCEMYVPGGLDRSVVLNLACRRGKGVFKLADATGPRGQVIGVDWRGDMIETAREALPQVLQRGGLSEDNIDFIVSYPEELLHAGIMEESLDVVYVNSVLNLFYNPQETLLQIGRLLKPAGKLVGQMVLATRPRNAEVYEQARAMGNVVQAAPFRKDFARWLSRAGFDMPTFETIEARPVRPWEGASEDERVPFVEVEEEATFSSCVISVEKLGGFDYREFLRGDIAQFR